jgi:hypothetical protein
MATTQAADTIILCRLWRQEIWTILIRLLGRAARDRDTAARCLPSGL